MNMTVRNGRFDNAASPSAFVYAPYFPPATDGGGPIRSLAAFVENAPDRWTIFVATSDRDLGASGRLPVRSNEWSTWSGVPVFYASVDRLPGLVGLWRLPSARDADVVYLNSFFNWKFSLFPQVMASLRRKPPHVVVATRGELGVGALGRRGVKKRLLTRLYRLLGQHQRVTFHASSELEQRDIERHLGDNVRIIVRPNETLLPSSAEATASPLETRIVFVGRLVPHKGLSLLLEGLGQMAGPVRLDVYGAEEDHSYVEHCRLLAANLTHNIKFHGSTEHGLILEAIRSATLLALPTAGENFGHVIVEALSVGCPVIVADTTPWSARIRTNDAGVIVDQPLPASWAQAIRGVAMLSREEQNSMRRRAAATFDSWQEEAGAHLLQMLE